MSSKNPWDSNDDNNPWNNTKQYNDLFEEIKKKASHFNGKGPDGVSKIFSIAVALSVGIYIFSGFFQVQPDERGVILRFGKWNRTVESGLHYALPYPMEYVIVQKVTGVHRIDIGKNHTEDNLMLTGDSNLANISFSVLWRVKFNEVEKFLFNAKKPEVTVKAVAESVMREVVGQTNFMYVQTEGRSEVQRKVQESLQSIMNEYDIGIDIVRVDLQRVEPPAIVVDSFRDVERAQAEQQSEKNKAEAYERDTKARTRGAIAEKLNKGASKKREIIEASKRSVAKFLYVYDQYKAAPDIISKKMYIDTMREIYSKINKIVIDSDVKSLTHLPLNEVAKNIKWNVK